MTDTNALITRLEVIAKRYALDEVKEAADALEAQARRIAELETKVIDDRKVMALNLALIEKQAWRIAELEAALKPFAENFGIGRKVYRHEGVTMTLVDDDVLQRCCEAARAALEKKND